MKMSESIAKISAALLKAQKEMEGAKKGAKNPFFKSNYADYGAVLEACKGPLNNNGITVLQPHSVQLVGDHHVGTVDTILLHESGEFLMSSTEIRCAKQNDPQALGSAITDARRYGLQSFVALPAEDDDGESAMNRSNAKSVTKTPAKPAPARQTRTPVAEAPAENTEAPVTRRRRSK